MSLDQLRPDEVVALRFDETAVAEDLARWCGGGVVGTQLTVPGRDGRLQVAQPGDWVVLASDGNYEVWSPREFGLRFGPIQG